MAGKRETKAKYQHFVPAVRKVENWYKNFNFVLIENMEDLKNVFRGLTPGKYFMSFDTETTGLDFEELELVGYSFSLDGKTAYYVPVYHFEYAHNLGEPAVEFIYCMMVNAAKVFMYNARYDMRVFEFRGYKDVKNVLDTKRWRYVKYDMSKVNYYDVAVAVWAADTNQKMPSLKWASEHFLGFAQMHFDEVIEKAGNFFYLNPSENPDVTFYAASDALCTYLLVPVTIKYFQEGNLATKVDNRVLYPLMHYETEKLWLDKERIEAMLHECQDEVDRLEREVYEMIGYQINLNSPVQVAQAFQRLGIDTGQKTDSGGMATGMKILENLPDHVKEQFPALKSFVNYKETFKLMSSYFSVLKKEAEKRGFLRGAYQTTNVPTGRLSAGKDSKNTYFSPINLQALPKPHVCMYDVFDLGDRDLYSRKDNIILGYKFVPAKYDENKQHIIPDDPQYIGWAEGMDPKLNVRSCIMSKMYEDSAEEEFIYVACDYAAQELRITANISKEPVWADAFIHGRDVHKACYSLDTEVLTPDGWKTYDQISEDTLIGQYNPDTEGVEWVPAGPIYWNESKEMYHFEGTNTDLLVTPNHRMYAKVDGEWSIYQAENLALVNKYDIICDPWEFSEKENCGVEALRRENVVPIQYDNPVKSFCFSVPSGLLVVRRNSKISVCGNTACQLWGEENYNKDLRKRAKGVNFGVIYGMGAPSMIDPKYGIHTLADAEAFFEQYKSALPTLFQWIDRVQRAARRNGTVCTFFGRPRRVKGYYDAHNAGFANRTATNTQIQGCLPYESLVLTDRGYRKIGDLYREFQCLHQDMTKWGYKVWNGFEWCDFFPVDRGKDVRYRLHFSNGQIIDCDSRHKVKVLHEGSIDWVDVNDLVEGQDSVCFMKNTNQTCSKEKLSSVVGEAPVLNMSHFGSSQSVAFDRNDIKVLCYLYGVILGDGHIGYGKMRDCVGFRAKERASITIYYGENAKKKARLDLIKKFLTKKGIHYVERVNRNHISRSGKISPVGELSIYNTQLCDAIQKVTGDLGGNVYSKRLGDKVFTLDRELVFLVLRGIYDTDGTARTGGVHLANEGLVRDIQLLMKYFGYDSKIFDTKEGDTSFQVCPRGYKNAFKAEITGEAGYCGDWPQSTVAYHSSLLKDFSVNKWIMNDSDCMVFNRVKAGGSCEMRTFRKFFDRMNEIDSSIFIEEDYDFQTIVRVEKTQEPIDTYTLCVLNDLHQFVSEGMISKNTAGDILKIVMCKLWQNMLNNDEYKDDVRFMITIHDEIGYSVRSTRAEEIIKLIEDTQTFTIPQWPIPLICEASVGWTPGGLFAVERVDDPSRPNGYTYRPKLD